MSKRLMPTYLIEFLRSGYNGDVPANFGKRLVSRQAIAFTKKLYDIFVGTGAPVNFGRSLLPEYLVKFLDDLRSSDFIVFEDDDTAFIKDVPDISDISCKINIIGGMSYKCLNVWDEQTVNGALDADGSVDTSLSTRLTTSYIPVIPGTIYYFSSTMVHGRSAFYDSSKNLVSYSYDGLDYNENTIPSGVYYVRITFPSVYGSTYKNDSCVIVSNPLYNGKYFPYFAGFRDSAVTSVVSKDASNNTVDTITIDASIQALEGYGQSNPDDSTEYNYIDLENKKYIEVGYIDNGVWTAKDDEIDISSYIDTNIIDIKENGTLTFTNTYDQAVPSSVDYYIPKEAFSNGN